MASLAQTDDLSQLLGTLTPAQLLQARQQIDVLLTPSVLQKANSQVCPLLNLPRNILDRIITYAVSYDEIVSAEDSSKCPGLLQTCHVLRLAASKVYFSRNTFKRKRYAQDQGLERWAKVRVGENRRHVRGLRLDWPMHCNNEEARLEASRLEKACGFPCGSVWCVSEDDFENDYRWWVNGLGETKICEAVASENNASALALHCRDAVGSSTHPAPSWYCSSWALGRDTDYFSLRRGPPTPESRPSARDMH